MLLPETCLPLSPMTPSVKSLTLRIVTLLHSILLLQQLLYMSFPKGVPSAHLFHVRVEK